MALTTNCTLIAALAALGPFAALGMQDPSMNTQIAFPKHVKESNTLGQLANSILAISEIATSSATQIKTDAPCMSFTTPGQEQSKSSSRTAPYTVRDLTPTRSTSAPFGYSYQIQLPAVRSGQTFTIQVPGYEVKSTNPVYTRVKSIGQGFSTSPSRRITVYETSTSNRWTGPVYDKKVSIRFANATAQKVLDWLTAQGISFAVDNSGIASDKRVTLNAVNKRLGDVISALGEAMGGQWSERNGFLVFRKGAVAFGSTNLVPPAPPIPPSPFGSQLELPDKSIDLQKIEELNLSELKDPIINEREIQLKMDTIANNIAKLKLSSGEMPDIAKITAEAQTLALGAAPQSGSQADPAKMEKARLQVWKELQRTKFAADARANSVNFAWFLDRLTVQQVEKAHSRGYVLFSELSPAQLKLIGVDKLDQGDLTLTITKGGRSVTLRSK